VHILPVSKPARVAPSARQAIQDAACNADPSGRKRNSFEKEVCTVKITVFYAVLRGATM